MRVKLCYINQHWYVYLYTLTGWKEWINKYSLNTIRDKRGEFRLRKYNCPEIPVYSFGYMATDPKARPGHGGEWSSNSRCINEAFGVNLIEVGVDQTSAAVPLDWLKQLLGDRVEWVTSPLDYPEIVQLKGVDNQLHKWVDFDSDTKEFKTLDNPTDINTYSIS